MRIRWSPEAASNLADIYDYLQLAEPAFLHETVQRLYDGIHSLRNMPYRGRHGRIAGTRELVFPRLPYIAVYKIRHPFIEIVSIRQTSRKPLTS